MNVAAARSFRMGRRRSPPTEFPCGFTEALRGSVLKKPRRVYTTVYGLSAFMRGTGGTQKQLSIVESGVGKAHS
jgi:hypothetical protein